MTSDRVVGSCLDSRRDDEVGEVEPAALGELGEPVLQRVGAQLAGDVVGAAQRHPGEQTVAGILPRLISRACDVPLRTLRTTVPPTAEIRCPSHPSD